ncbi:MAG: LacI family DNA-binding transcriptional regulator [Chloroflexota bacterium]
MTRQKLQKVTIKDIAQMCSVSTQTVSRVLNKKPDVSTETREAVEKAIAQMGYRPSMLARSLVRQRSYTIGVILAGLKYLGVSQTLNGIAEACERAGYALFVKELPRFDTPNIMPVIEALMAHQVEGIIFAAPEFNENVKVAQSQIPATCPPIIFLKCHPNPNYTTISIDNYGGARKAVTHFFSIGRRHVGLITGPLAWLESRQRKQGWEDTLKSMGVAVNERKWVQGNWSSASGESAFAELIQKYPAMNALFASNDQMALGALHYANTHDIRVPEDIAIIGFDDLAEAAYFTPALSTITHPLRDLGVLAVETLLEQVGSRSANRAHREILLQTELVLRDTTPKN